MKIVTDEYAWLDDKMNDKYAAAYARYISTNCHVSEDASEEEYMNRIKKYADKVTRFGLISMRSLPPKVGDYRYA